MFRLIQDLSTYILSRYCSWPIHGKICDKIRNIELPTNEVKQGQPRRMMIIFDNCLLHAMIIFAECLQNTILGC